MVKKVLLGIVAVVVVLIVGFLALVSTKSNAYIVERTITVQASPTTIFPLINDFQAWEKWSPFEKLDPNAKVTFSAAAAGKGATMAWDGNDNVGAGTLKILECEPDTMILMEQEFSRPQQGKCDVIFELVPKGGETNVKWRFSGNYDSFVQKAVCTLMNMDAMLGPKLEEGLEGIKREAERPEQKTAPNGEETKE